MATGADLTREGPLFEVVRGRVDDDELAALTVALCAVLARSPDSPDTAAPSRAPRWRPSAFVPPSSWRARNPRGA